MAQRRMFSKTVVDSAKFLRMPQSSRLLYYDLGVEADDDGVVEAFAVMRKTGANDDDLRVLLAKGFLILLDEEDLIVFITDWSENNNVQKDRYKKSRYSKLLYAKTGILPRYIDQIPDGYILDTACIQNGNTMETQDRLGKDRLGKDRKEELSGGGTGEQTESRESYYPLGDEQFERQRREALAKLGF